MATSERARRPRSTGPGAFLGGTGNLVGGVVALGALGAGYVASDNPLVAVVLAAAGYAAGYLLTPRRTGGVDIGGPRESVEAATIERDMAALQATLARHASALTPEILAATDRIFDILGDILPKWQDIDSFSQDKYTISAILTDYVPGAVTNYLKLPRSSHRSGSADRAAHDIVEQLDIIHGALATIRDNLYRGIEDDIVAQGIFLRDKFARGNPLDLG